MTPLLTPLPPPAPQLREVLASGGPEALLQRLYREYLQQKLEGGGVAGGGGKPKKPLKEAAGAGGRCGQGALQVTGSGFLLCSFPTSLARQGQAGWRLVLVAVAGGRRALDHRA